MAANIDYNDEKREGISSQPIVIGTNNSSIPERTLIAATVLSGLCAASYRNVGGQLNTEHAVHKAIELTDELLNQLSK